MQRKTLGVACLAVLMVQLDTTIVNLGVHAIQIALGATVASLQWVVDAYNIVYASLILTGGLLGDRFGRRRWFMIGLAVFTAASVACALAPSSELLTGARAIAGLGAALTLPGSLAVLTVAYPHPAERTRAVSMWAGVNGVAIAIGPTLGGVLVDNFGWRALFLIVVPVGLLALALARTGVAESSDPAGRQLDLVGQFLAISILGLLAFAAIQVEMLGWQSPLIVGSLVTSGAALGAFVAVERRATNPLVPLGLLGQRALAGALLVAACMTFGMYGMLFLVPLYLQSLLHVTGTTAGLVLLPLGVVFAVVSPFAGRMANRFGATRLVGIGMALSAIGLSATSLVSADSGIWFPMLTLGVTGLALGIQTGPLISVAVGSVPAARAGTASSLINVARLVGATLGVAVLGSIFATLSGGGGAATPDLFLVGLRGALLAGAAAELLGSVVAFVALGPSIAVDDRSHTPKWMSSREVRDYV